VLEYCAPSGEREPRVLVDLEMEIPEKNPREDRRAHDQERLVRESAPDGSKLGPEWAQAAGRPRSLAKPVGVAQPR